MVATDVSPTRLAAAQQAAREFVKALPSGVQIGLVDFSTTASVLAAPTSDRATVLAAIDSLQAGGGTATAAAIKLSVQAITTVPVGKGGQKAPGTIVLMSDGSPTIGENGMSPSASVATEAAAAKAAGVKINTIAFGTPNGTITIQGEVIPGTRRPGRHGPDRVRHRWTDLHAPKAPTSSSRCTTRSAEWSATTCSTATSPPGSSASLSP